jgi:hypothetical protein
MKESRHVCKGGKETSEQCNVINMFHESAWKDLIKFSTVIISATWSHSDLIIHIIFTSLYFLVFLQETFVTQEMKHMRVKNYSVA